MTKYPARFTSRPRQVLILTLLLLAPFTAHAEEIYKSVDKHGNITYSDTKTNKQAESVKLPAINTQPAVKPALNSQQNRPQESLNYQVSILTPLNGDTLHNNQRRINVNVSVRPALKPGFYLQAMLDGMLHGQAVTSEHFTVGEFNRGEHTLSVAIIDANGKILTQSASITLYVKRPSLNSPARKAKAQS